MLYTARIEGSTATTMGIPVPDVVLRSLGQGAHPAVVVTLDGGYSFRATVEAREGAASIPIGAAVRKEAGIHAGDTLEVDVTLDVTAT